jgi:ornithine cyclodeaminase/alanine dehydrogenase-like protein (mu-crystallin family)
MRYLSSKDLIDLISPAALVAAMEEGLRDLSQQKTIVPERLHVEFGDNTLLTMPAIGGGAIGAKVVSVVPSNTLRDLPVINGLMTLCDGETGIPLAVLDATTLTALRTGAVGAVGLKWTTPVDTDEFGIIGTGVQGTWQAIFACSVRRIRTIYYTARSDKKALRFVSAVSQYVPDVLFSRCADANDLLSRVHVIITATSSFEPVLPATPELLKHKHFIGIGSFKPSMTELPHLVYQLANEVFVDSEAAKLEAGDLVGPLSLGLLREDKIIHIADLVAGKHVADTRRPTVFKSVGMALYDLYAARAFLGEARRVSRGTLLEVTLA